MEKYVAFVLEKIDYCAEQLVFLGIHIFRIFAFFTYLQTLN